MFNVNVVDEKESLIRKYTKLVAQYDDGISLAIGEPLIPVDEKIINRTIKELIEKKVNYTNAQGDEELLNEICIKENVEKDNVLVTFGSSEGIFITLLSILNKDEEVILVTPCYPQYAPVIKFCMGNVRYVDTLQTNFIPTYENLIKNVTNKTKAIIINSPSNPSGICYDKSTLITIEKVAKENNLYLLMDDVYENLIYTNKEKYNISYNKKIVFKSFSKSYGMTGFRLGYIIAIKEVINQVLKVHSYLCISTPVFIQKAGIEALRIKKTDYSYIEKNLYFITKYFDENNIEYIDVNGGIFIFILIKKYGISSEKFCDLLLQKYHVACVPGICFNAEGYVRINFAIDRKKLLDATYKIAKMINEIKKD